MSMQPPSSSSPGSFRRSLSTKIIRLKRQPARLLVLLALMTLAATALAATVSSSSLRGFIFGAATSGTGGSGSPVALSKAALTDPLWTAAVTTTASSTMTVERRGHTATLLADGKVLVTGGENANGFVTQAEIYDPTTATFSVSGNPSAPRADHTATRLSDGRVLIAGGRTNLGPTNSTEIFDPTSGAFNNGPNLNSARSGQSATALSDGRIVFAGGDAAGSVEIYDPQANTCTGIGATLTAPRAMHSAALLNDGNILVVGGKAPDGSNVLTGEILNVASSTFSDAGNHTADEHIRALLRVLPDGKVQIIGGTDHEDMEIYDPAINAFGAHAHVFPIGDIHPELLQQIMDAQTRAAMFRLGASSTLLNRTGQTIIELSGSNQALVTGGVDSSGAFLNSASTLNSSAATITTDKLDYAPGTPVIVSGTGWQPNEVVTIMFHEDPHVGTENPHTFTVQADADGNFVNQQYAPEDSDLGITYILAATGGTSGRTAQTALTDAGSLAIGNNAISAANICAGSTNVPIHSFSLSGSGGGGTVTGLSFVTTGSYAAGDIVNFKLYYTDTTNSFSTTTLVATIASPTAAGTQTFPTFSRAVGNNPRYFWISMDVVSSPTSGHTIAVNGTASSNVTADVPVTAGPSAASGTQTLTTPGTWLGTTSTDWNVATNWSCSVIPTSTTDVTIPSGGNQPVIGAVGGTVRNLTINSGATLTITGSNNLSVAGSWNNNSGTFTANTSTVTFTSTTTGKTIAGTLTGASKFNNLTFNGLGGGWTFSSNADVGGNFTITNGSVTAPSALTVTGNWTNSGTFTHNSGTVTFNNTTASNTQTLSGNTTFNNLTVSNTNGTIAFGATTTTIANTFSRTSGTTMDPGTGTIIFTGAAGSIAGGSSKTFYNLQINSGASITQASGTGNVTINNNFANDGTFSQNSTLSTTFAGSSVTHSLSGTGTTTFGTVTINGTNTVNAGSHNFTVGGSSFGVTGTFNGGTGTVSFNATTSLSGAGNFNFNNLTIGGTGNLTSTTGTINVSGNWSNSGSFSHNNGTVTLNGNNNTQGLLGTNTFNNLTINHTGTGAVTAATSVLTVNGLLRVQSGSFTSATQYHDVQIDNGGTLALSGPISVNGNWTMNAGGIFTPGTNNVTFNGATGQTISGDTTFYDFTKSVGSAQQFNFTAGSSTTVTHSLTFTGVSGQLLTLRSTLTGTQWNLNAPTTQSVSFVDVKDSNANSGNTVRASNSVDSGNNLNWSFSAGALSFKNAPYSDSETNADHTKTIAVQRTGGVNGAVSVHYATSGGTATAGSDYVATSGDLNWSDGDSADKTFTVTVKGDTTSEPDETINLTLSAPTNGATIGGTNPTTLTILNDDASLSIGNVTQAEGNSGTSNFNFTITLANASTTTVSGTYSTANGTATAGSDYTAVSGAAWSITAGSTTTTVPVSVNGDTTSEPDETFTVTIVSAGNTITNATGTGTIQNDDASLSIGNVTQAEGNSGTSNFNFTITLSNASASTVSGTYSTANGTATAGSDYTAVSGAAWSITAGQTSTTVPVSVTGDTTSEADETFTVTIASAGNTITNATGTGTIQNDDASLSVGNVTQAEGNSGTSNFNFTITLANASASTVSGTYSTANGTATAGSDYTAVSGAAWSIPAGSTTTTVPVSVNGDTTSEPDETFTVTIVSAGNTITNATGTGTIQNDDASLSIGNVTQAEGNSGSSNFNFTITLSNASTTTVSGTYSTADGTATAGSDYTAVSGAAWSIPAGQTSTTVPVSVTGDTTSEPDETFTVTIVSAGNTITNATGTGTIQNDDASLSIGNVTQAEGNAGSSNFNFTITLTNASASTVSGTYSTANGTATAGSDYTAVSGAAWSIPAGSTTTTVPVSVNGDTTSEPDETFTVTIASTGNTITNATGTGTIQNDDASLSIGNVTQAEGNSGSSNFNFTITLSNASTTTVSGTYSTANGTATAGSDYTAVSGAAWSIPAGSTTTTVPVSVNGDTSFEANETFTVTIASAGNTITNATGTGTITNDDTAPSFTIDDVAHLEGNSGTTSYVFTVSKTGTTALTATVHFSTADGTAMVSDGDYQANSGTLTFAPGDTTQTITVLVNGDTHVEPDENFFVNLDTPTNATISDSQGVGTIQNDDTSGTYLWVGPVVNTLWSNPLNWSPTRLIPTVGDILIFDGGTTPSPTVTGIPTETDKGLHFQNGVNATFNADTIIPGAKTLTISGAGGDLLVSGSTSLLTLATANKLDLLVTSGATGSVAGQIIVQDGAHQLLATGGSTVTFTGTNAFTTAPSYSSSTNPFGTGTAGNGSDDSIIFANNSIYTHNNGASPFGASATQHVVVFQTGSEARYLTATGFDAKGRSYSKLTIGDGSSQVEATDAAAVGNFQFDQLTVNSPAGLNSKLEFDGSGTSTVTIKGNITSTGAGAGGTAADVILSSGSGGIVINSGGATTFGNVGNSRGILFGNNATVNNGTTLTLGRILQMSFGGDQTLTVDVTGGLNGGTSGYVVGKVQKNFTTGSSQSFTFHIGDILGHYTPAALANLNVTGGGNITGSTTGNDNVVTGNPGSFINVSKDVNRSWNLTRGGGLTLSLYDASFTYAASDIDGAANEANFILRKLTSGTWTAPPGGSSVNTGTHTITGTGFTDLSDFAVGEAESADLQVTNSDSPDPVNSGENITYTIVFTNNGPDTATSVTLSDLLSLNTTFVSTTTPAGWTRTDSVTPGSTGTLTFTKPSAANGESATFTVVAKVNSNVAANIHILNKATATSATNDPNSANNTDITADTTTQTNADLEVTKTDSPDPVTVGNNITYTISFTNHGPSDAQNVTVTDAVPAQTTFVSSAVTLGSGWLTSNPSVGGTGNVVFSKTSVTAGETATFTVVVKVDANATTSLITNNAVAASTTTDPTPGNNTGTATTTVIQADLVITNSDSPDPVNVGENITYTIVFTNNGPSSADALTVSDVLSANTTFVSTTTPAGWTRTDSVTVGSTGTLTFTKPSAANSETATFTVVAKVNTNVAGGIHILNKASATSTTHDPDSSNNTDITADTLTQTRADLEVTKTDSPDPVIAGNNITYTVNFTNHGPSDAQNVTVTDSVPANTTFVSSAVTVGTGWTTANPTVGGTGDVVFSKTSVIAAETATFTVVVKVDASTADLTTITNNAVAASTTTDPTPANNTGTATTTVHSPGTISFSGAPFAASETNADHDVTITVQRTGGSGGAVSVHYATSAGTATVASDYIETSGDLNWADGDSADKTFTVTVKGDTTFEPDETVNLTLSAPTNGAVLGGTNPTTLTIQNDDSQPTISVGDKSQAEGNTGTSNSDLAVSLSNASYQTITVHYTTVDGTASQPSDYTTTSGTLTFAPGETNKTVSVSVNGDTTFEADETFTVTLDTPTNATILDGSGLGTIQNDDTEPAISIGDKTQAEGNAGTSNFDFAVSLSNASYQTITVHYTTVDGTATQPSDYTTSTGTLTFAPGETNKTVSVSVNGDTTFEADETFTVTLDTPTNATIADGSGLGTIQNDDTEPAISIGDKTQAEGNAGTSNFDFAVTLSNASYQTITVHYTTVDGTATQPSDYTTTSGTLTFAPGETNKTVSVSVNGDTTFEADETFTVTLDTPTNATILDGSGLGTITNDDTEPAISIGDKTQAEGNAGTSNFDFAVTLSNASYQTITVHYTTVDGTASQPSDYTTTSGTLTFAPGETNKTVSVSVNGDTTFEADETFTVTLDTPTNATILDGSGVGTITNDDTEPAISIGDKTQAEGNAGTSNFDFAVTLSNASYQTITVHYTTVDGTASQPSDYTTTSGTLTFAPGETNKTVSVSVNGDTTFEADETFTVTLDTPTNATILDGSGLGTIQNDDTEPAISIGDKTQAEGNAGTSNFDFAVTLSNASYQTITVHYATNDGTATQPSDYTTSTGTLTFAPGETNKTVSVSVNGDTTFEADETFTVTLDTPTNATILDGSGLGTIQNDDTKPAISIGDKTQAEGNAGTSNFDFAVTLSNASYQTITVHYATNDGTATQPSDYTSSSGTLTFAPGETNKTVSVSVNGDTTFEADETFTVTLDTPTNATILDGSGLGTITNDDTEPAISIGDKTQAEGNSLSSNFDFAVTLSNASYQTITVHYTTVDGTASQPSDYTSTSGTVTFAPGETNKTVSVSVNGDTTFEADETFTVTLDTPTNATILDGSGLGTITNDDTEPAISIGDKTQAEGNAGTSNFDFAVSLSNASYQTITVHYATNDGTATQPSDYTTTSGTLTFAPGETNKTVSVSVNGDTTFEADETFTVTLDTPTNATILDGSGLGTITNDDTEPAISIGDKTQAEGNAGTSNFDFAVTLSNASYQTITVHYTTVDGTASQPSDYTTTSGTLTFAPGETNKTVSVSVNGDTTFEADETFTVTLDTPTNATILDGSGLGTIQNDDTEPAISIGDKTQAEGNSLSSNFDFAVTLSNASYQTITVHYATNDGTATQPSDYTTTSGTLTFAPGETNKTVSVSVNGDTTFEADETFTVTLDTPTNATILDGSGLGTIQNDDTEPAISIGDKTQAEGNAGTSNFDFAVSLSNASYQTITVHYATNDGTATQPSDYTTSTGTLTFAPGETNKTVSVSVNGDTTFEADETFTVTLDTPTNATILDGSGLGTITNDDTEPAISIGDKTQAEGNAGTSNFDFAVTLSNASYQTITVHYTTVDGTASQPSDYTSTSGTVTFAPGETNKTVSVSVNGDTTFEADETFTVTLDTPTNATIADGSGLGTITNDDTEPAISIGDKTQAEGNAGTSNFDFAVSLSNASYQTITVHYATNDGTATQPSDYTTTSGTLTFAPGETNKTVSVSVNGDTTFEADETFTVTLDTPTNATILDGSGLGTITNDDTEPAISIGDKTQTEGNAGTSNFDFAVTLSNPSAQTVTVHYTTVDGTATQPSDYTTTSGTLTFAPGETNKTVSVSVNGDTTFEADETFTVTLDTPTNATILDGSGLGTITNDDTQPSFSIDDVTHNEGNSGTTSYVFTVTKNGASDISATVHFATVDGTATQPSDYASNSGTLTFAGGVTTQTITVLVNGDTTYEANEAFTVHLSSPTNATISDADGTGTITNDDSQPSFSIDDVTHNEGNSGTTTYTFTVTKSGATASTATVDFATANGTTNPATGGGACGAGIDYVSQNGTLTFAPGDTTMTVTVTVCGDTVSEPSETFFVNLSNATNASISDNQGVGTITNDDAQPSFAIDDVSHNEGNSGTTSYTFTVTKTGTTALTSTVDFATADGTATLADSDYQTNSGTLTFLAGDTSKTITVLVNGDTKFETNETFNVNLSNATNATISDNQGVGTITNDDAQPSFAINDVTANEGNSGTTNFVFTVTKTGPTALSATVDFATANGTATLADSDYQANSGTLTFAPGDLTKTITVLVNGDTKFETDETFNVNLSNATNATISDNQGVGTITNDDAQPSFAINDVIANEGNSGTTNFVFTVTKTGTTALSATVNFATANGTTNPATGGAACGAGIDYVSQNGTLTFAAADTTMMVTVTVCGDTVNEANETFFVNLSGATNATIADNQGLGTITNDDTPGYTFEGFFAPIDNPPIVNTVKAGSAVPVKWRLTTAGGAPVSDPNSFVGLFSYEVNCGTTDGLEAPIEVVAPGGSGLTYQGNGNWQINWKTLPNYPKGSCRVMDLQLNDGTHHYANFKFK